MTLVSLSLGKHTALMKSDKHVTVSPVLAKTRLGSLISLSYTAMALHTLWL